MKCYKTLFSKNGLINNIGSYILLIIFLFFIVSSIIFYLKGYNKINIKFKIIYLRRKKMK